jgi:transcription elongation factor Elf1
MTHIHMILECSICGDEALVVVDMDTKNGVVCENCGDLMWRGINNQEDN